MSSSGHPGVLLALDAGIRGSGWAVFNSTDMMATGVIGADVKRGVLVETRLCRLITHLDLLLDQCRPSAVAYSLPSGIHWPTPALDLLHNHITRWSQRHGLPTFAYTAQEVRAAIAGHPNASRDKLAYEVMAMLGLIGQWKTVQEWKALAVGCHHLSSGPPAADGS